ncbi:hypothetical protein [Actinomadura macra]|uniref:hypothetical protein n=1 Tax=Actinomadura macra TaxID=46164 RepID=UPI0012F82FA6|nr:hypothetical protein [Actinomadura macra]
MDVPITAGCAVVAEASRALPDIHRHRKSTGRDEVCEFLTQRAREAADSVVPMSLAAQLDGRESCVREKRKSLFARKSYGVHRQWAWFSSWPISDVVLVGHLTLSRLS